MCLSNPKEIRSKKKIVYKVFCITKYGLKGCYHDDEYQLGYRYESRILDGIERSKMNIIYDYPPGFHGFIRRRDALIFHNVGKILVKVLFEEIHTMGDWEKLDDSVVAKFMTPLEIIGKIRYNQDKCKYYVEKIK